MSRLLGHSLTTLVGPGARQPGSRDLVLSRAGGEALEQMRTVPPAPPARERGRWQRALLCALVDPDRPARFGPG